MQIWFQSAHLWYLAHIVKIRHDAVANAEKIRTNNNMAPSLGNKVR